jgi:hypothetical protein
MHVVQTDDAWFVWRLDGMEQLTYRRPDEMTHRPNG